MRRAFLVLVLLAVLAGSPSAYGPIAITNNHGKLEMFIITPEDAVGIGVVVECEHTFKTSAREVRFRQEAFLFRDLHDDAYEITVAFKHRDGHESRIVTHANVSR